MGPTPIPTFPHRKGEGVKKAICLGSLCPAPDLWVKISSCWGRDRVGVDTTDPPTLILPRKGHKR